ncbi:MAG: hypothetical protein ACI8RZ_003854 [Myxococcota bacterium]
MRVAAHGASVATSTLSIATPPLVGIPAADHPADGDTSLGAETVTIWETTTLAFPDVPTITSNDPDEPILTVDLSCDVLTDDDGDGYEVADVGGTDCDDTNAGSEEVFNAADDNFDGDVDGYDALGGTDIDAGALFMSLQLP